MNFAFDLDGVLVDTQHALRAAYLSVGVTPPDNFNTVGWETWCTREQHDARNEALPSFAELVRPLPLLKFALQRRAPVLSSCSRPALKWVQKAIPSVAMLQVVCELRFESKLNAIRAIGETGVYFDDNSEFCDTVARETRWQACRVL